ncbi:BrnT family toxin [Rhodospirillum sp. A1_3_36]|uniref:BrnT family toxin n=1 Tax=Rhodospirillum sp. A1_3_36 TaxID=3391666 RepID=UPI0039A63C8B
MAYFAIASNTPLAYILGMENEPTIACDPNKEKANLRKHGVSLALAAKVLAGEIMTTIDERFDYGEERFIT